MQVNENLETPYVLKLRLQGASTRDSTSTENSIITSSLQDKSIHFTPCTDDEIDTDADSDAFTNSYTEGVYDTETYTNEEVYPEPYSTEETDSYRYTQSEEEPLYAFYPESGEKESSKYITSSSLIAYNATDTVLVKICYVVARMFNTPRYKFKVTIIKTMCKRCALDFWNHTQDAESVNISREKKKTSLNLTRYYIDLHDLAMMLLLLLKDVLNNIDETSIRATSYGT